MIWGDDEATKKIDIDELLKKKEQEPSKKNYCYPHFWVKYQGLNEEYWFCRYCDIKSSKP